MVEGNEIIGESRVRACPELNPLESQSQAGFPLGEFGRFSFVGSLLLTCNRCRQRGKSLRAKKFAYWKIGFSRKKVGKKFKKIRTRTKNMPRFDVWTRRRTSLVRYHYSMHCALCMPLANLLEASQKYFLMQLVFFPI